MVNNHKRGQMSRLDNMAWFPNANGVEGSYELVDYDLIKFNQEKTVSLYNLGEEGIKILIQREAEAYATINKNCFEENVTSLYRSARMNSPIYYKNSDKLKQLCEKIMEYYDFIIGMEIYVEELNDQKLYKLIYRMHLRFFYSGRFKEIVHFEKKTAHELLVPIYASYDELLDTFGHFYKII